MKNGFAVVDRIIGPDCESFIIAKMSGNHNDSKVRALEIVRSAAESGADCLKFQAYNADTLPLDSNLPDFRITDEKSLSNGRQLHELYSEAYTPWEMKLLKDGTLRAWHSTCKTHYYGTENEPRTRQFRQSIYPSADIAEGELFGRENLKICRPGMSQEPRHLDKLLDRPANRSIRGGERLSPDDLAGYLVGSKS